jgi:hypothetical protein
MRFRIALLLSPVLLVAGLAVARASDGPDADHPIVVDGSRIAVSEVLARGRSGPSAGNLAIEERWLAGELGGARGLTLRDMRARVADRLAGAIEEPKRFAAVFEEFQLRWRARTVCLAAFHDPVADRCSGRPPSAVASCLWMAEVTVCRVAARRGHLVLGGRSRRSFRTRGAAIGHAFALYRAALASRVDAARRAAREEERRAAEAARARRVADPRLSREAIRALQPACRRYRRDIALYLFAGLQDPAGWADGVRAVRSAFERTLRTAPLDSIDRVKAVRLATRLRAGTASLDPGDVQRFVWVAVADQAAGARSGLGDRCLVAPGLEG